MVTIFSFDHMTGENREYIKKRNERQKSTLKHQKVNDLQKQLNCFNFALIKEIATDKCIIVAKNKNVEREINFQLHRSSLKKPSHIHYSPLFSYIEALTKVD